MPHFHRISVQAIRSSSSASKSGALSSVGRLSSSDPNLQAITRYPIVLPAPDPQHGAPMEIQIRDSFVAAPGCLLLSADYSQIELRVLAHLASPSLASALC